MPTSLSRWRDRAGHGLGLTLLLLLSCAVSGAAAAEGPGSYKAQRFDVVATARDGALDVTETITFEFQSGTFRKVWRDIPAGRTDGIEILEVRMDGTPLSQGEADGRFTVSGRSRVKVQWNFAAVGPSVHAFQLRYVARGVIYREGEWDVLRWRPLPAEHRYAIDASRIAFAPPGAEPRPPESHRIDAVSLSPLPGGVVVDATGIRRNGWLIAELRYPGGTLMAAPPAWQQRSQRATELGPRWIAGAAAVLALGLLALVASRQGYAAPSMLEQETTATSPPEPLPAAVAAVLAARGRTSAYQGIATILDLADRGVLTIREAPKMLGVRTYELSQRAGTHDLDDHEAAALDIAFAGGPADVPLSRARARLARGARRFIAAINEDLERRGFVDPARRAVRDRLTKMSFAMLIISALGSVAAATLIPRFEAWPFLLPLALLIAALAGIVMAASTTPLSDRGLLEAARWRGFKRHLKALASARDGRGAAGVESRWIVYAIAVGLASPWSRYLRAHPGAAPPWFLAASRDDGAAFAAFVGSNAAASGSHGGGAGGGAAGGGGSGAG